MSKKGSAQPHSKFIDFSSLTLCNKLAKKVFLFWTNGSVAPNYTYPEQTPHTAPALRRAAEVGDGWLGFHLSPEEVAPLVQRLYQYAVEAGRHGDERFIGVVAPGQVTPEGLHQYRDAGVRHLVVRLPTVAPERLETALGELRERRVVPVQAL